MKKDREQKNQNLLEWYDSLIFALIVLVVVFTFVVRVVAVSGNSMVPTLHWGDRLLIQSTFYTPKKGDVVVLDGYTNLGKPLVKRIIACEGDTVELDTEKGLVYVNGQALEEPYTAEPTYEAGDMTGQITVPEGCVFVMGDNRNHSTDSRFSDVGFVDSRDILGRVLLRIFPMDQFGGIA